MARFFTVQKKSIIERIQNGEEYYPDFSMSTWPKEHNGDDAESLLELYNNMLRIFNHLNESEYRGLVFAFIFDDETNLRYFEDYKEFEQAVKDNEKAVKSLWNGLNTSDNIIVELEYHGNNDFDTPFYPLNVDLNDFQAMMPNNLIDAVMNFLGNPYTEEYFTYLIEDLCDGMYPNPIIPAHLVQAHLPYIKKENIVNTYSMFSI